MSNKLSIYFLVLLLFFFSCFSKDKDKIVASVNEKNLLLSDVLANIPDDIQDSTYFVEKFMNDWIRKELMLSHAEMNVSADLVKYEKQIEDYRASLLIYAYQKEILKQELDTVVSLNEIETYYNQHKDEFRLSKNIFKGRFLVIEKTAPNIDIVQDLYKSEKDNAIADLEDYCQQFAREYYLRDTNWQYFSVINNKLPNLIIDEGDFLERTNHMVWEDESMMYYLFVKDYQKTGTLSPLILEKSKIREVLLNKRKVKYLKKLEDDLYQEALSNKKIKIY